jgi:hypothetical protein
MKKITLSILVLFFCATSLYAQTITPDKSWHIEYGYACPEMHDGCCCYSGTTTIKTGDIRTFNGKEYYELLEGDSETKVITYVREENGKVFFYVEDCDKEYLLYDYNLNIDEDVYLVHPRFPYSQVNGDCELTAVDSNYFCRFKVTDVDEIEYNGVKRKRLKLESYYNQYAYDYWVEGIGNMTGITCQVEMSGMHQLKDCYVSDELIFVNENPRFCWVAAIVNSNSTWTTLSYVPCPQGECNRQTQYVYFNGDSIVGNYTYKQVFSCNDNLHENITYKGLMREQSFKTFFIPAHSETEYLLYDFNLIEGKTFEYQDPFISEFSIYLYVKKNDLIIINENYKKRMQLTLAPDDDSIFATWIQDRGSLHGLFYPCGSVPDGVVTTLLCYFQDDELMYKNPEYSECYYEDLAIPLVKDSQFSVYPNPTTGELHVTCHVSLVTNIEVFDMMGRKIHSQSHGNKIDASAFPKGLYLLKIYAENGQVSLFKIVKK